MVLLASSFSYWFFLRISISPLLLPIFSCMLSTSSTRALSILIIVVLNLRSGNFDQPAISESHSVAFPVSFTSVFVFSVPCSFLPIDGHDVWGCRNFCEQAFVSVAVRRGEVGSILSQSSATRKSVITRSQPLASWSQTSILLNNTDWFNVYQLTFKILSFLVSDSISYFEVYWFKRQIQFSILQN